MAPAISLTAIENGREGQDSSRDSSAPSLEEHGVTLCFRLTVPDEASLEALRYARRSVLREERTLGVDEGEPLLEEAEFSVSEVRWRVPAGARERCLEKLADLVGRANRALEQNTPFAPPPRTEIRREP
jgi:hypothetical protein